VTAALTAPSRMLLHSDNLSVARLPFKRTCDSVQQHHVAPFSTLSRYTQQLAQEGLGILLAAWNVSQMAPASMMSSMISVQVRVFCAVFFLPPTAAGRCQSRLLKLARPSGAAPVLCICLCESVEYPVAPQVCALFQVQHNGQRRRQRAAPAWRYTLLLQAFRPGHAPPQRIQCDRPYTAREQVYLETSDYSKLAAAVLDIIRSMQL
jgi:hypothetical protein